MMTGRKLDLLLLTDHEAEHVLQVVQRDMRLRKKEEVRLSELKQELDEEGSRCLLLSRQSCFNQRCCIRCCSPFTFLLNPKRKCQDCNYNVCKACCVYCKPNKAWLCSACQRSRLLKTRSLEWFYTNVKKRFKRFGSAKVLKTLYRKHLVEHSVLSKLTEGSAYEESICNEGSICGSDSTFYRQTEEHSMAETHSVALRVAEEAVDEAITKAEIDTASQETQDEVSYLREHRRELIEELAKTIVQKIIHRKKTLAEMRADYDHERTMERYTDLHHPDGSISDDAAGSTTLQSNLWRSHSAFSLLDGASPVLQHTLKKEGSGSAMAAWRSVDRLDSAGVLKSPDGNWIALQSAQRSRTNLVTKRKSLVYSALERESMIVSAYEGLGSDDETKPEPDGSWGAVLLEIHKKMADERSAPSPTACLRGSKDNLSSDCDVGKKPNRPLMGLFKWKVPVEIRRPSSSRRTSVIDLNFNLEGAAGDQEKAESPGAPERVRRSRKKRRSRKEVADSSSSSSSSFPVLFSDAMTPDTLTCGATTPKVVDSDDNISEGRANHLDEELRFESQQQSGRDSDSFTRGGDLRKQGDDRCDRREGRSTNGDGEEEQSWSMEMDLDGGRRVDEEENEMDEEMRNRLYRLVSQSRQAYFSSTNDGLDRTCESEGGWDRDGDEDMEEEDGGRKEDGPEGFLSTEDQLDRVYVEGDSPRDDEDKKDVELAVKVCRLVHQVHATEFSSTEDELDRAGCDREEELIDAESLWKLQAEKAVQAAQLRDLASLVSASQFSSTEDELDRIGESEGGPEGKEEPSGSSDELEELREEAAERRESIGEIDVNMFDLREDIERSEVGGPERGTSEDISRSSFRGEEVAHEEREFQVNEGERAGGGQTESERIAAGDKKVAAGSCRTEKESREKTVEAERRNPTPAWQETQTPPEKEHGEHGEEAGRPVRECKRSPAHSDEEDAEFDRIISSMLLMTLEDMQAETMLGESGESGGGDGPQGGVASPEEDEGEEVKRRNSAGASEEKGRAVEESQGDRERTEWTGGKGSRESGGGRQDNEEHHVKEMQRDSKEASTKPVQLSMDGLLSPQEIQHVSHMEFFPTVQLISTLLEQRYAAMSLCSVTTEVLKLLNATEGLLHGEGGGHDTTRPPTTTASLPPDTDPKKLDQQFSTLEGNVYVAAGSVYRLEVELSDLEECARGIRSSTSDMELSFLEEQVAAAAAKVQQSDMQISDISARIAALKSAGLNVDPQTRFTKSRNTPPPPVTLDSSRQLRRRLPTPPVKDASSVSRISKSASTVHKET